MTNNSKIKIIYQFLHFNNFPKTIRKITKLRNIEWKVNNKKEYLIKYHKFNSS